jgi:GTP pyrophosphokinase
VGNKAIAAKVNQRLVTLNHVLKTGDKIEIITAEDARPQPDWLQFVTTHRAKNLVTDYFRTERKQTVDFGRTTLENAVTGLGYRLDETLLQRLEVSYGVDNREALFYGIGIGTISLGGLADILKRSSGSRLSWIRKVLGGGERSKESTSDKATYIIGSTDPDAPQLAIATCCNPIPGDPVVGFKAPDGQITVHKKACPVAESIAAMHGDWVVVPKWPEDTSAQSFLVRITIRGLDRVGLVNEITRYLSLVMGVNMRRLSLAAEKGVFDGYIDLYVSSRGLLDRVIKKISAIEGVESVTRSEL